MKVSKGFLGKLLGEHGRVRSEETMPFVLAVMGTDRGVGTTHFCMAALNFLLNVRGLNAVMAELNPHPAEECMRNSGEEAADFILPFERIQMAENRYDVVILDISSDYPQGRSEFLRGGMRLLLGSLSPWKSEKLENVIKNMAEDGINKSFICLSLSYNREAAGRIKRAYGIDTQPLMFIENPLSLKPQQCVWLNEKLESIWK